MGLTASQLAKRLGHSTFTVLKLEKRELTGRVTIEVLDRAARAMGCRLVYAIVPNDADTLEALVDRRALAMARRLSKRTSHTMALEGQGVDDTETANQTRELAEELKVRRTSSVWDDD